MSSVYVRYLLPALVVAGCAVLALVGRRRRGHRRAVEEHSSRIVDATPPPPTDPASELAWRRLHGEVLADWIAAHEDLLDLASADDFSGAPVALDRSDDADTEQLDIAVAAHPNPRRRAELSAMRAAARSTLVALTQGDYERARRHHLVYCDYRKLWQEHTATGTLPDEA